MGKNRESGRSKTRPSSSSLAASLLPTGVSNVGFGGFVGSSRIEGVASGEEAPHPAAIDGEIAQHLSRLGRKDPVTKLKALISLSSIFKQKSEDEIVKIIPQWAFEYKKLLNDYNREVRRATHESMTNLVITVRKGLATHLKSLMGPWWFSQFDEVSEISQAARRSLEVAFPVPEKRLDALTLYSNEIFLYLDENLRLTPQSMSDKATPADELEDIHHRVVSLSLVAIATLIEILQGVNLRTQKLDVPLPEPKGVSKARMTAISVAEKMFSSHNYFLEFLKSRNPLVRSSTYTIMGCFIRHIPQVFNEDNLKIISTSVMASLQEKDSSCHSSMWDMILLFLRTFPNCWSYGSVQKNTLNRLYQLLKNGFYGSYKISCPVLVVLLDLLPSSTAFGEQFIMNFFEAFWAGRYPFQSSYEDRCAIFKAFKECFLWGLFNASRFSFEDNLHIFQVNFVDNILVKFLWRDYIQIACKKDGDTSPGNLSISKDNFSGRAECREDVYAKDYVDDVGNCILQILSVISLKDQSLLTPFSTVFQRDCLEILHRRVNSERYNTHIDRISNIFLLLDQLSVGVDQTWSLCHLACPLIASSFTLIKSLDSPDAVRVLNIVAKILGPKQFVLNLFSSNEETYGAKFTEDCRDNLATKPFLQLFKNHVVPWCLTGRSPSISSRLDLLISLLDTELLYEQWHSIIVYATSSGGNLSYDNWVTNADRACIMAMLLVKVRDKIKREKIAIDLNKGFDFETDQWRHELLDNPAISIVCHPSFTSISHARFLSAAIGGSLDNNICFLSQQAVTQIVEVLVQNLVNMLATSSYNWVKEACSFLSDEYRNIYSRNLQSLAENADMALFSIEVLERSFFCLNESHKDNNLVAFSLAAIIIIEWENRMTSPDFPFESVGCSDSAMDSIIPELKSEIGGHSQDKIGARLSLGARASAFRCMISSKKWSLSLGNLLILRNALTLAARSAIFDLNAFSNKKMPELCCSWILDVLELVCPDHTDEQSMLDQLFLKGKDWPMWVGPEFSGGKRSAAIVSDTTCVDERRHHQFVAFVEKLIINLGVDKVLLGLDSKTPIVLPSVSCSRSWLAAELLCTWRWNGGSVLHSFLPLLCEYAKNNTSFDEGDLVSSLVIILLDGSINHGFTCSLSLLNVWTISEDEIEHMKDPFLRALVAVLLALIVKNTIWCNREVVRLFECVVSKLFIGTSINISCLRVLPFVLNIISKKLLESKLSGGEELVQKYIFEWFQIALALPPLLLEQQKDQDLEGWIHVIVSLYPLRSIDSGLFKVAQMGNIDTAEKKLLLIFFRRQRLYNTTSKFEDPATKTSHLQVCPMSIQKLLARVMAVSVGYCWNEFEEDDWNFVLSSLRRWIQLVVPVMEEISEKIDDSVSSGGTTKTVRDKLELAIQAVEPVLMDLSMTALIIFSLVLEISDAKQESTCEVPCFNLEKWDSYKDRILNDVLRLFFSTGAAEAIARCFNVEASWIVAISRFEYSKFWEVVASCVLFSANHLRKSAVQSVELWGISAGAVSSMYALLFSYKPMPALQFGAFHVLSTEPLCLVSLFKEHGLIENTDSCQNSNIFVDDGASLDEPIKLRDDISFLIENPSPHLLEMDLLTKDRVNFFLAWALLLSHLQSLPYSSVARERLVQHIQDSVSSIILDCIFQYIPLKSGSASNLKKKESELPIQTSKAASAAKHAISTCSLTFAIKSLWPAEIEQMASLAGAVYGLTIRLLPAYVRNWFGSVRDRALSSAIETFTKGWCSPSLIADEFMQVKEVLIADENFSVNVSKSAFEIVATYKKEETGMDLVMRLPSCYPLRPVEVDCTRSLGISEVKQRKWLLSLTAFVRNQNGAIAEAIRTWRSNFDKEFQGVEECPICYSIIHTANHSLPRLPCKTCKHKFHSACLYKWFSTSHKSLCPLCQMPF